MENHGQKRSADEQLDVLDGVQALLLDIEGTTTPITFVKDKLQPYIRENVKAYLEGHYEDDECREDLDALRQQVTDDKEASVEGTVDIPEGDDKNKDAVIDAVVSNILNMMDKESRTSALKKLLVHIWREAYKTGLVQGEVFADVVPILKQWSDDGLKAYTYSMGSVEAQKQLFSYSDKGNLSELFSGHYDTEVGAKDDKESYVKISADIGVKPDEVAFFTDLPSEARAAGEAGLRTVLVVREGTAPLSEEDKKKFMSISSFTELTDSEYENVKRLGGDDEGDDDDDGDLDDLEGDGEVDDADDADDGSDDDEKAAA